MIVENLPLIGLSVACFILVIMTFQYSNKEKKAKKDIEELTSRYNYLYNDNNENIINIKAFKVFLEANGLLNQFDETKKMILALCKAKKDSEHSELLEFIQVTINQNKTKKELEVAKIIEKSEEETNISNDIIEETTDISESENTTKDEKQD